MDPKKNVKISPYPNKIKDGTPSLGTSYAASVVLPKKKKKDGISKTGPQPYNECYNTAHF